MTLLLVEKKAEQYANILWDEDDSCGWAWHDSKRDYLQGLRAGLILAAEIAVKRTESHQESENATLPGTTYANGWTDGALDVYAQIRKLLTEPAYPPLSG